MPLPALCARQSDRYKRRREHPSAAAIKRIEDHMDRHSYVPLGDNEQVQAVVEMAYREVGQLAERYVAILNGLYGSEHFSNDDSAETDTDG